MISSIKTPIYPSLLSIIISFFLSICLDAFTPAINPWQAASSYPLVPLIVPAVYSPFTIFDSNVNFNW